MARRLPSLAADLHEEQAAAKDHAAQERGPATSPVRQRVAPHFMRGVTPDGVEVVFVPGEALPGWAAEKLAGARLDIDGVLVL